MYREEPLNKQMERLQGDNDGLNARIEELEENGAQIVNVWHVNWGNVNWSTLLVVTAIVLSGLMIQAQMLSTVPALTVIEVERSAAPLFRMNPVRAVAPTMIPPRTNWVELYPTDWVLPEEELLVCDGMDNDCPDYGLDLSPLWVCESVDTSMASCHFEQPSTDPTLWENGFLRFGNW